MPQHTEVYEPHSAKGCTRIDEQEHAELGSKERDKRQHGRYGLTGTGGPMSRVAEGGCRSHLSPPATKQVPPTPVGAQRAKFETDSAAYIQAGGATIAASLMTVGR